LAGLVIVAIVGRGASHFVNINRFSLHALYRNRLTRGYLGGSNATRDPDPFSGFDFDDDVCIRKLWPPKADDATKVNSRSLFHVVNIALNVVSTQRLAWQERKAESFTASALHCGAAYLGFRDSWEYGGKTDDPAMANSPSTTPWKIPWWWISRAARRRHVDTRLRERQNDEASMLPIEIVLVDTTGTIAADTMVAAAAALNVQVTRDVPQFWGVSATVSYGPDPNSIAQSTWPVQIVNALPNNEGGYHRPIWISLTPRSSTRRAALVSSIDGIWVSDFVTPSFYDPVPTPNARYSFTGAMTASRQILPGGYISWLDPQSDQMLQILWVKSGEDRLRHHQRPVPQRLWHRPRHRADVEAGRHRGGFAGHRIRQIFQPASWS
jgi:hypothetical protein